MSYLLQCLRVGERRAVKGLQLDWTGYVFALRRLKSIPGQKASIAIGHINCIPNGLVIRDGDPQPLSDF